MSGHRKKQMTRDDASDDYDSDHSYQEIRAPHSAQAPQATPSRLWCCATPFVGIRKKYAFPIAVVTGAIWFGFTWLVPSSLELPSVIADVVGTAALVSYFASYIGAERRVQQLERAEPDIEAVRPPSHKKRPRRSSDHRDQGPSSYRAPAAVLVSSVPGRKFSIPPSNQEDAESLPAFPAATGKGISIVTNFLNAQNAQKSQRKSKSKQGDRARD